jgi:2'-5' RNA ligase
MSDPAPLIVTVTMDAASASLFEALRRRHFPRERNHIPAHLTLFHALPGEHADAVAADLAAACATQPPFGLAVTGLTSLGRGVAYRLESADLAALRRRLAERWQPWLTAQDRQSHRPHVTVQNKVAPERAKALLAELAAGFVPFTVEAEGLLLWRYRGGPWDRVREFAFEVW